MTGDGSLGSSARDSAPGDLPRLVEVLSAADGAWNEETGDEPLAPQYIEHLANAVLAEVALLVWLHAEAVHKLTLPCGSCHPCSYWAEETWRRAGRTPPTVFQWDELRAELDEARVLLETYVDPSPCHLDHHGYCQEHGWLEEGECNASRTVAFLAGLSTGQPDTEATEQGARLIGEALAGRPRVWRKGDDEPPPDVHVLRGTDDNLPYLCRVPHAPDWWQWCEVPKDRFRLPGGVPWGEATAVMGDDELVQVVEDQAGGGS